MTWIEKLLGTDENEPVKSPKIRSELIAVEQALTSIDQEKAPYIACLTLLYARLAGADLEISEGEKQRMVEVLQKQSQLTSDEAKAATEIASAQELANSIDHYRITETLNEMTTTENKHEIIRALFYIACDEDISEVESEKIRSIAKALRISNGEYIKIRSEFREYRSILKNMKR